MAEKPLILVPLELQSIVCSSALTGNPVSNIADHRSVGLTWKTEASPSSIWARGQFDGTQAVDFVGVVAANAQPGTKIRVRLGTSQAQVDGSAPYDSGALDFISPAITHWSGLYHSHLELPSVQNATWWRIDITGHTGVFEASSFVFGKAIRPSRFYNWDYEFGAEDLGDFNLTPWGIADETPGLMQRQLTFTLAWQTQAEFEADWRELMERKTAGGLRRVVFCCFDPEAHTARQAKTYMGWFDKPPYATGTRKPGYTQDITINSLI